MTHPWVMDNNCVKYNPDPTWQWGVMAWTEIWGMSALWPWPWIYALGLRSWHTLGSWTTIVWNIIQIQHSSEELWPRHTIFGMCTLWPWPWRYDLRSSIPRCEQTDKQTGWFLWSWTIVVWNIIQIQHGSEKLWLGHWFLVCVHGDHDLSVMAFGQRQNRRTEGCSKLKRSVEMTISGKNVST